MSFFEAQFLATIIILPLRMLMVWTRTNTFYYPGWEFVYYATYIVTVSWFYTLGYFIRGRDEANNEKIIEQLQEEHRRNLNFSYERNNELERNLLSSQDENDRLQKTLKSLRAPKKEKSEAPIKTRSAIDANQVALQNFL